MDSKEVFNYLMGSFKEKQIEYVILHSYQELPEQFDSDIDIAIRVPDIKKAIKILDDTLQQTDWQVIQFWRHEYYAADCVISNGKEFLQVDFCIHYERNGRILMQVEELVSNRLEYKNIYIPAHSVEFTYILIKKILKKCFSDSSKAHLYTLLASMDEVELDLTKKSLKRFLSMDSIEQTLLFIKENNFDNIKLEKLNLELRKKSSNIKGNIHYAFFDIYRKLERIIHPTGMFIVLLGVDGAGKTTIANELMKRYVNAFRKIKHYHSRVRVLKDISQIKSKGQPIDASNPHSKKDSAGKLVSLVKFVYYYLDYMIGNVSITKSRIQSSLVLIERYYFDYYIDTVRYNLNLSTRFLKFFEKFVKKPDAIFILTGDSKILLERKHEITIENIEQQKKKFKDYFSKKRNAHFIDTTISDVDECVDEIIKISNRIIRGRRKWQMTIKD